MQWSFNDKKAKDWDGLELFYKMDRVEGPKLHAPKLRQGAGVIYSEDRPLLHSDIVAAVPHGGYSGS